MKIALERGVPDLILLQDDLEICKNGGEVMDKAIVPDNCIATTFCSAHALPGFQTNDKGKPRYIVIGAMGTAQGLKIPRRSLEYLCVLDPLKAHNIPPLEPHLFDDTLFAYARISPTQHVAHLVPNVIRHVGKVSACGSRNSIRPDWVLGRHEEFPADPTQLPSHVTYYERPAVYP